jgi:hypothetical protein
MRLATNCLATLALRAAFGRLSPLRFRPVVRPDVARCSVLADELLHHLAHLLRSNVALHMQRVSFARVFIHHAQHPKSPSFHRPIMDEVPAPNMSPRARLLGMAPGGLTRTAFLLFRWRHRQALLAAHLPHSSIAHTASFPPNQTADLVSSELRMFPAEVDDALLHQLLFQTGKLRAVTIRRTVQSQESANLALAAASTRHSLTSQLPAVRHAYRFFSIVSCRTLMPNIASAYIFLSSVFCCRCAPPSRQTCGPAISLRSVPSPRLSGVWHPPRPSAHISCANGEGWRLKSASAGRSSPGSIRSRRTRAAGG